MSVHFVDPDVLAPAMAELVCSRLGPRCWPDLCGTGRQPTRAIAAAARFLEQPRGHCTTALHIDALTQSSPPWTAAAGTGRWQQWLAMSVAAAALCVGGCYCATRVRALPEP